MLLRAFTILSLFIASASWADSVVYVGNGVWQETQSDQQFNNPMINDGVWRGACDCNHNSQFSDFSHLLHQVNIIGQDRRALITDPGLAALGLTPKVIAEIRNASGYVICPGTTPKPQCVESPAKSGHFQIRSDLPLKPNFGNSSAFLVGSNMEISANSHILYDNCGQERSPLTACYFRPQPELPDGKVAEKYPLVFDGSEKLGIQGPVTPRDPNDHAVFHLSRPVEGVRPLTIDTRPMKAGEAVIGVSSFQLGINGKGVDSNGKAPLAGIPVGQPCIIKEVIPATAFAPTNYKSTCSSEPGASGGYAFVIENGEPILKSMFSASGSSEWDYHEYDGVNSVTTSIGFDANFLDDIVTMKKSSSGSGLIYGDFLGSK